MRWFPLTVLAGLLSALTFPLQLAAPFDVRPVPVELLCGLLNDNTDAEAKAVKPALKSITDNAGIKLVLIPAGEFTMGADRGIEDEISFLKKHDVDSGNILRFEYPRHKVQIRKQFWMGAYHITRGQFARFVADTGYKTDAETDEEPGSYGANAEKKEFFGFQPNGSWRNAGFPQADDHPVINVSWNDAKAFCAWLSGREGATYRLPTEAEWEYACRAGTTTRFWSGEDPDSVLKVANTADAELKKKFPKLKIKITANDGFAFTSPVGSFKPNPFGLYDMHGNANQWCEDGWRIYDGKPNVDPVADLVPDRHGIRGGSWRLLWSECRCASHITGPSAETRGDDYGFRVVREYRGAKAKPPVPTEEKKLPGASGRTVISVAQQEKPRAKDAASKGPVFTETIRPLLKSYCFECHNANKRKAGLDLEKIDTDAAALDLYELWDQVGERLHAGEMPPAKSKQPTEDERRQLLAWVKHVAASQVSCANLTKEQLEESLAGYTMSRRLNRIEYNNTLRDLFGVDLHAGDLLPSEGGGGEGFDNTGATLFTTPVLMEKYLEAAELVLATLFPGLIAGDDAQAASKLEVDNAAQLDAVRRKLVIAVPGPKTPPREAARKVLDSFLPRAFRRPPAAKEVERYLSIFDKAAKRGASYEQSLKLALKGVLISPSFLFLIETPPEKKGIYRLGHYEMASHLSYFLWASMPDEELLQLAAQGKLHDEKVLRGQVERMMRDPRARGLADSFAAQWLGIRPLGTTIRPDAKLFPEFTEELAAAMREETVLFFGSIVREDRSVLGIIDADYTFVNERLAAHYKIDGIKGPQMRRVKLDDSLRGGVLGQASILTVTSYPHRTSPVLRGRWILEELLGADVPPPPPNVPVLNEKKKDGQAQTLRQMLEKHRSKTECASCHSKIDPLGFGLENFDPLGRWRSEQGGGPIDSTGVLPSGEKFDGPAELKKLLMEKRRPEFLRNLCRKMLGYALSREINRVDMCVVQDCVAALEHGEFRASRLLEAIVTSYPFLHRYQKN